MGKFHRWGKVQYNIDGRKLNGAEGEGNVRKEWVGVDLSGTHFGWEKRVPE
jgi:hypothetical protein